MASCHKPSSFSVFCFSVFLPSFLFSFMEVLPLAVLDLYWECVSGLVVC